MDRRKVERHKAEKVNPQELGRHSLTHANTTPASELIAPPTHSPLPNIKKSSLINIRGIQGTQGSTKRSLLVIIIVLGKTRTYLHRSYRSSISIDIGYAAQKRILLQNQR